MDQARGWWRSAVRGRPDPRPVRSWVFDVLVAAVWTATLVPDLLTAAGSDDLGPMIALTLGAAAALVVRRRWPWPTFLVLLVGVVVVTVAGLDLSLGFLAFVALYTVIVDAGTRTTAIVATVLLGLVEAFHTHAWAGGDQLDDFLLTVAVIMAVTGLALYRAARLAAVDQLRDRAELLAQRAALLERDQEQGQRLAVSQERVRIAAEMHDVVGHHLTVMVTLAEGTLRALPVDGPAAASIGLIADTGREALTETRRILGVLRTAPGADPPTAEAVEQLRALIAPVEAAGVAVRLEGCAEWEHLPSALAGELLRVVQEALTNVLKHAGPGTTAQVELGRDDAGLQLTVADDGAGTPTAAPVSSGSGVTGIARRLSPWSAQVHAGPRSGGGWLLDVRCATVPVPTTVEAVGRGRAVTDSGV